MSPARTATTAAGSLAPEGARRPHRHGPVGRFVRARLRIPDRELSREARGFREPAAPARGVLEAVPFSFRDGYDAALDAPDLRADGGQADLRRRLEDLPAAQRGFAYEGAAMALGLLDALSLRGRRWRTFAEGVGLPHVYMVYVGLGFAAARLRRLRAFARPELDDHLRWLVVDGVGFHDGFFRAAADPVEAAPFRETSYAARAFDQGLGRSLWFVEGARPEHVAERIARFDTARRADLWSGVGLAACYAGGVDADGLRELRERAAEHAPHLAQGVAFAAEARERAGNATAATELACRTLWNGSSVFAAELVRRLRENLPGSGHKPAYEVWRARLREAWAPASAATELRASRSLEEGGRS